MKPISFALIMAVLLVALVLSACTPPTPTSTPTPAFTPTELPTPTLTPTSVPINYTGRWDAGTLPDGLISGELIFQIEKNEFTIMRFSYTMRYNGCTIMSSYNGTVDQFTLTGNEFTASMYGDRGYELTIAGTFASAKEANGTLKFKGNADCGEFERNVKWNGVNGPIPPTPTATVPKPTATITPTSTPFRLPTIKPAITPQPTSTVRPELQALANAFTKTRSATIYRATTELSATPTLTGFTLPAMGPEPVLVLEDDQVNGKNRHTLLKGLLSIFVGADATKGLEVIVVDGKTFVHGPTSLYGAIEDKWYLLDPNKSLGLDFQLNGFLAEFASSTNGWAHFEKARSGIALDGVTCDLYTAGSSDALAIFGSVLQKQSEFIANSGNVEIHVCNDGYVHNMSATVSALEKNNPSITGTANFRYHFSDPNGDIRIPAPANFETPKTVTPTPKPAATSTPIKYNTEFPLPSNVLGFFKGGSFEAQINYQTTLSMNDAIEFYRQAFTRQGLKESTGMTTISDKGFSIVFTGAANGKWLVLQGTDLGATRNINLRYEPGR
jgi:hypothetical protein